MLDQKKIKSHFKKNDPVIYEVMKPIDFTQWWGRPKRDYFAALCEDIIGQQLSAKAADSIFARFEKLFGKKQITPEKILKLSGEAIRGVGTSWAKVKSLKDLAQRVKQKQIHLDKLEQLNNEQALAELIQVKGVGPWTAEMFLIFTLKREDVFSFGDLGLNKAIIRLYGLKRPSRTRLEKIIKPWTPYRSFGALSLWYSLDNV
jgi:DNA-3-methyladenine glycosylase II